MKIAFLLFCFKTVVTCVETQPEVFMVHAGEDFRNIFKSFISTTWDVVTYLCRSPCRQSDMLMQVHGRRTKSGRYTLRLENQADVQVTIVRVIRQDAGLYRVGMKSPKSETYVDFQLVIKDLCGGGLTMQPNPEYWVSKGSNLNMTCNIALQARNRKFLCRGKCSAYLMYTNDLKGYSAKYSVEYMNYQSFKVTIYNLSECDSGQYCCGAGSEDSPNQCQRFTIRVKDTTQSNRTEEGHCPTADIFSIEDHQLVPNSNEGNCHSAGTGPALPIVITVLVGITLTLGILLIRQWKKTQAPLYVNSIPNAHVQRTGPADRQSQSASFNSRDPLYVSLNSETRERIYDALDP